MKLIILSVVAVVALMQIGESYGGVVGGEHSLITSSYQSAASAAQSSSSVIETSSSAIQQTGLGQVIHGPIVVVDDHVGHNHFGSGYVSTHQSSSASAAATDSETLVQQSTSFVG